jgi:hypothetical protein
MEERLKLSRNSVAKEEDATFYRKLVGGLRYLVHTRPDLIYAIGYLSRFMQRPTAEHMAALKWVLRYVTGTINYGCFYKHGSDGAMLIGYSDYARDVDTSQSTSSVFFLGSSLVSWNSSSKALLQCRRARQSMSPRLLQQCKVSGWHGFSLILGGRRSSQWNWEWTTSLLSHWWRTLSSMSAASTFRWDIILCCSVLTAEEGSIRVEFISTKDQPADIGMKALGRVRFQELCARIGMVQINCKLKLKS